MVAGKLMSAHQLPAGAVVSDRYDDDRAWVRTPGKQQSRLSCSSRVRVAATSKCGAYVVAPAAQVLSLIRRFAKNSVSVSPG